MSLSIYDTLRREKVPFETREPGAAAVYVCGPTVYGDPHIGHGRFAVVFDVLNRWLRHQGLDVTFVMNITDVDDKIINRSNEEGVSPFAIADRYTAAWNDAMDALGVHRPDVQPHAVGHILDMQQLIADLIDRDIAYESDGNVLFRVRRFDEYGKLSGRNIEDAQQPADVAEVVKDDPIDFALWKAVKPGEPSWPSPWGPGRPGWHIECSVMAAKHLGAGFDLHGGGIDLVFPHHENEIAQHEAATGETFVRYWMHNGMVRMSDAKMSKSIGNVIGIADAVARWGRGPVRVWYATANYRSPLTFDEELLQEASASFDRLLTFVRNARILAEEGIHADRRAADPYRERFTAALDDDLNLPGGLAALHEAVTAGNERLDAAESGDKDAAAFVVAIGDMVEEFGDDVLGFGIDATLAPAEDLADRIAPLVDDLLARRAEAREQRQFERADEIRSLLGRAGIVVEDRPDGSRWYLEARPPGKRPDADVPFDIDEIADLPTANI